MKVLYIYLFCFVQLAVIATPQSPDKIYFNGIQSKLLVKNFWSSPLEDYFHSKNLHSPFTFISTGNYRGYIATWQIEDQRLFLTGVSNKELMEIFPEHYENNRVHADWFSGEILVFQNKLYYIVTLHKGKVSNQLKLNEEEYYTLVLNKLNQVFEF